MPNGFVSFVRFVFFKKTRLHPITTSWSPSPINRGKSAIRQAYSP